MNGTIEDVKLELFGELSTVKELNGALTSAAAGKVVQIQPDYATIRSNGYAPTGIKITVLKSGRYNVTWMSWRSTSFYAMGTNLHVNDISGANQAQWLNGYGQYIRLENQHYDAGDVLEIFANSGSNSAAIGVGNLIIEEV